MSRTDQMSEFEERAVSAAEADLERLLSIEPSPEFVAKVRTRIAAEPPVRTWNWGRLLVPVGAAAALVLVVTLAARWNVHDSEVPATVARQNDVVLPPEAPQGPPAPVTVEATTVTRPTSRRAAVSTTGQPEIVIDHAITDAIRRLALAARNTTLDGSKGESIAAPDSASDTLPIAEDLNVPELVLKPADQTGGQ